MRTRIISAFPGMGKSYYHNLHSKTTMDSDSSLFSWVEKNGKKIRNPDFPNNYIKHIKETIGKYEFIFVSTHKEVRDALLDNCIFFYLIYPPEQAKTKFLKRYEDRGNDDKFVKLLKDNWENWINELYFCTIGCKNIRTSFPTLKQEIKRIITLESKEKV